MATGSENASRRIATRMKLLRLSTRKSAGNDFSIWWPIARLNFQLCKTELKYILIKLKRANQRKCVENGLQPSWGEWSEWSACSATCINPVTGSMVKLVSRKIRFHKILSRSEKRRETANPALSPLLAKLKNTRAPGRLCPQAAMKGNSSS